MGQAGTGRGSSEVELSINHPNLQGARVVSSNGDALMKVSVAMGEKEYNVWADSLLKYHRSTSKILLPVKHSFSRGGFCGQLGTVDVTLPLSRSTTPPSPTCSPTKYTTGRADSNSLTSRKCGTSSSAWPRPKSRTKSMNNLWAIYDLITSSSTRKGLSSYPTGIVGPTKRVSFRRRSPIFAPICPLRN